MLFEWDPAKAASNARKHGVTFEEAVTVLGDSLALTFNDPDRSVGEHRMLTFGIPTRGKLVVVAHTERNGNARIISARPATSAKRKIYEEG